jgi:hypothetical protein
MRSIERYMRTHDGAFDDAAIRLMSEALDAACTALGGRVKHPDREIMAIRIIDETRQGERDPIRLRDAGIAAWRR